MSDTLTSFYSFVSDEYVTAVCDSSWSTNSERESGVIPGEMALALTINTALRSSSAAVQGIIEWAAAKAYSAYKSDSSTYSAYSTTNLANISLFSSYSDISDLINTAISYCIDNATSDTLDSLTSNLESIQSSLENGTITAYYASHLGSSTIGSAGNPIYLSSGSPINCSYISVSSSIIRLSSSSSSSSSYSLYCGFLNSLYSSGAYQYVIGYNNSSNAGYNLCVGYSNTNYGLYNTSLGFSCIAGYSSASTSTNVCNTAIGYNSLAKAQSATAVGSTNTVTGSYSSALGYNNTIDAAYATAVGNSCSSSGPYSLTLGYNNTAAGSYSIAAGYNSYAAGSNCIAIGTNNNKTYTTSSSHTIAIGHRNNYSTAAASNGIAIGYNNTTSGTSSIAIGQSNTVSGEYSTAIGYNNTVSAAYATAIGNGFSISTDYAIALGSPSLTIGGSAQPMYVNSGVLTACSSDVGDIVTPAYMSNGTINETSMYSYSSCDYYSRVGSASFSSSATGNVYIYTFKCEKFIIFSGNISTAINVSSTSTISVDTIYRITLPTTYTLSTFVSCTATSTFSYLTTTSSSNILSSYSCSQILNSWGTTTYLYIGCDKYSQSIPANYYGGISFVACYIASS